MSAQLPHVEVRAVSKRFGGAYALDGVDVAIRRGSIHALVGENGAGKSTLGKVVAGACSPDSGELVVDGARVAYRAPHDALADGITLIAQELALVPRRTVIDNVFLGVERRRLGVVDRRDLAARYCAIEKEVSFGLPPKALVGSLRLADQQKVEILRAIARDARLIVMDEPTASLPADDAQRLFATIRLLRERGTTIVYVSHFLEEVLALADVVTVMRDGRVVKTAAAADETPATLVAAMLGRSLDVQFPPKAPPAASGRVVCSVTGLTRRGAFDDVSLTIREGEILGLAGLVGSGRTEVARAIFGADRIDGGAIEVDGRPLVPRHPRDAIRAGVALLPESRKEQGLHMQRSITSNVTLPHLRDVSRGGVLSEAAERQRATELIERVEVRAKGVNARVATLSGGNQQKVLFAKWLYRRPLLLIADEPTRGVDVGAKRAIYSLLHSLAAEGMAILLISSEIEEVLGLAHRVLVMRGGAIVAELDGATATEADVVHAAFATESARVA